MATAHNQKMIILGLAKMEFDQEEDSHIALLETFKNHLAIHIQKETIKSLTLATQESEYELQQELFEKDIYETIGFSNGLKPYTDLRAVGTLGLVLLINFMKRINNIFQESASKLNIKVENIYI